MIHLKTLQITHKETTLVDIALTLRTTLGLVGQSGSGKSLTLKALLGLLPASMTMKMDLQAPFELIRGRSVGFVPQNPFTALSPLSKIGVQFHAPKARVIEALEQVGLGHWALDRFPAELSGGQLQRVVIAMALIHRPKLLLLDEPTTALDHETKAEILALLEQIHTRFETRLLFVGHDMAAVSQVCAEIAVIDRGQIVENGPTDRVIQAPATRQSRELIESNFAYRDWRR